VEDAVDFDADCLEDFSGRSALRYERRDAPQCCLLVGELSQRLAGLRICDRRRNELCEPFEPFLCIGRKSSSR
jgi:hypothetical protein